MQTLSKKDVHHVISRLPKDIASMLRDDPRLCIGGGIIRALIGQEKPSDIDVFGPSQEVLQATAKKLSDGRVAKGEQARIHTTDNAVTVFNGVRLPVQFITRWTFTEMANVVQSFDFTVCQAVIFFDPTDKEFKSLCSDDFYPDLAARRLVYTSPVRHEDAGGSLLRVIKYVRRGYSIQVASLGAVAARLYSGIRPESAAIHDEGERAKILTGLLRQVDPLLVIDGIDIGDEDEHNPERAV